MLSLFALTLPLLPLLSFLRALAFPGSSVAHANMMAVENRTVAFDRIIDAVGVFVGDERNAASGGARRHDCDVGDVAKFFEMTLDGVFSGLLGQI